MLPEAQLSVCLILSLAPTEMGTYMPRKYLGNEEAPPWQRASPFLPGGLHSPALPHPFPLCSPLNTGNFDGVPLL